MIKRPRIPPRRSLVKRLDKAFSIYIRNRDGNKCVLCGSVYMPQCGHVFSRVSYATRWDEENAYCQCASCNYKHEHNAYPFIKWIEDTRGRELLDRLQAKWNKPRMIGNRELYDLVLEMEKKANVSSNN